MQALAERVRDRGVEAEGLLEDGLQVRHGLEVSDGELGVTALADRALHRVHLVPEACLDVRLLRELEEGPAERVRGRFLSGDHNCPVHVVGLVNVRNRRSGWCPVPHLGDDLLVGHASIDSLVRVLLDYVRISTGSGTENHVAHRGCSSRLACLYP